MAIILICYYSVSGNTKKMAKLIAEGASIEGCEVILKDVDSTKPSDLVKADAIIIGSPDYYGTMTYQVKRLIDKSDAVHGKLVGKIGGAFSSAGRLGGGAETTINSILWAFYVHGMIMIGNPDMGHFGPAALEAPDEQIQNDCFAYGERIAQIALTFDKVASLLDQY